MISSVVNECLGGTLIFSFGFYSFHITDLAVILIITSSILNLLSGEYKVSFPLILSLLLTFIISINMVRGLIDNSGPALIWGRANLATAGLPLLAACCSNSEVIQRSFRRAVLFSGSAIAVLCYLRLAFGADFLLSNANIPVDMINDGGRPLTSGGAFNIALAASIVLSDSLRPKSKNRLGIFLWFLFLAASEIFSGQGTSSVALFAMSYLVIALQPGPAYALRIAACILFLLISCIVLVNIPISDYNNVDFGPFDLKQRSNNLGTRENVWEAFRFAFAKLSLYEKLFGVAAGNNLGFFVLRSGYLMPWSEELHSMYFGSMRIMGYFGLIFLTMLFVVVIFRLIWGVLSRPLLQVAPAYAISMCVGTLILSFSYELRNYTLIGLFIAIWWYRYPSRSEV